MHNRLSGLNPENGTSSTLHQILGFLFCFWCDIMDKRTSSGSGRVKTRLIWTGRKIEQLLRLFVSEFIQKYKCREN